MDVHQALGQFVERFNQLSEQAQRQVPYDPEWPSPCVQSDGAADGELVAWQPALQQPKQSFDNIEQALEVNLHKDIKQFYTCYWSDNLVAKAPEGECELLQAWNEADFARLQENIIGHVLMKRRLSQPITIFFGVTNEEDFILTLDNETGAVMLEQVGCEPKRQLAATLVDFLAMLEPA